MIEFRRLIRQGWRPVPTRSFHFCNVRMKCMADVIVIGGGVIGCSIAWRLAQAGLKVTLFDRGRIGCEASRAAAGMLTPQGGAQNAGPFFDLCLRSRTMYRRFADELTEASGID